MKKTINVNIGRTAFIIDEDAYRKLEGYLNAIEGRFSDSGEQKEIMEDIESRVAELLLERLKGVNQVASVADISYLIEVMGSPQEYLEEESGASAKEQIPPFQEQNAKEDSSSAGSTFEGKRLYRDVDNRVLAGVCAGLEHYLGVQVVWLRVALLLTVVFAGFGVIPYLILWVVIPKALTTTDKLRMKGEPVDLFSIAKTVEENVSGAAKKVEGAFKKGNFSHISDRLKQLLFGFGRLFKGFFGVLFLMIGFSLLIPLFISLFGNTFFMSWDNIGLNQYFAPLLFEESVAAKGFYWGMIMLFISLIVLFMSLGFSWLLNVSKNLKWVSLCAFIAFIASVVMISTSSAGVVSDFKSYAIYEENTQVMLGVTDTLKISSFSSEIVEGESIMKGDFFAKKDFDKMHIGYPVLEIIRDSSLSKVHIQLIKESRASSKSNALDKAKAISYEYHINDNELILDPAYTFEVPYRIQRLTILLRVPAHVLIDKQEYVRFFRDKDWMEEISINEDNSNFGIIRISSK